MITTESELKTFQQNMKSKINLNSCLKIEVHRSNIFAESFSKFQNIPSKDLLQKIVIDFIGEEKINNELSKNDWFTLLAKELVNVDNKLFVPTTNENIYQPNALINTIDQHIDYFRFAGKFVALSIINGIPINLNFAPFFLKHVLHHPIKFKDIEDIDPELYSSLQYMLNNDVSSLDHTFSINNKNLDCNMTIELKPGGTLIKVTNENKKEYVELVTDYLLQKSIIDQIKSFCEGFNSLIPHEEIKKLTSKDLDLLIYGAYRIDVEDLIANMTLISPYTRDTPVIKFFFDAISKWNNDDIEKLLIFITGSPKAPSGGFSGYKRIGRPISIQNGGFNDSEPVSHKEFNLLDLPDYKSEEELDQKLKSAIQTSALQI